MSAPRKVLFVCTGNICRSALAEHLLRRRAAEKGLALEVGSCGIGAEGWFKVPDVVRRLLAERGVADFKHTPRLATRELLRWADVVLVMTSGHRDYLRERFPEFTSKLRLLREEAGLGEEDVADPMGKPDQVFVRCRASIEEALDALEKKGF